MATISLVPKPSTPASPPNVTVTGGEQPQEIDQKKLDSLLLRLLKEFVRGKIEKEKIYLYAQAKLMEHYFHGRQQLIPKTNEKGEVVDFTPISVNAMQVVKAGMEGEDEDETVNQWIVNDFQGDVKKFVAVLGNKSPNMAGRSRWPADPTGQKRARTATDCGAYLHSEWKLDRYLPELVTGLALRGPVFIHTPWQVDEEVYGSREVPQWESEEQKIEDDSYECLVCGQGTPGEQSKPPVCAHCGRQLEPEEFKPGVMAPVAVQKGTKKYPNGTVGFSLHSVLDVTTPFWITGPKDAPWWMLEFENDPAWILEKLDKEGKLEEEFKSGHLDNSEGSSVTSEGRKAREEQANPWGGGTSGRWTGTQYWLQPMMYRYLLRCSGDEDAKPYIQYLRDNFPRGLKITQVGQKLLSKENISVVDEWSVVKVGTEKYIYEDPHFASYVQIQDMMNDAWGMEVELRLRHIPVTYFDPQKLHPDQVNRRVYPGQHIPLAPGSTANEALFKSTPVELVPTSHEYIMTLREIARELVGLFPAVFGGEDITPTAEQSRRKLNQALMVLSIVWNNIREGLADATKKAILQLARYSGGHLASADGVTDTMTMKSSDEIEDLLNGGWVMTADQAIPMNWSQLKDFVMSLFQGGEAAMGYAQAMGATIPSNIEKVAEGLALPGWKVPNADARRKLMGIIDLLLKEEPVPMGEGVFGPSRPYQPFILPPDLTVATIQEWLVSDAASDFEGTPGYDNVLYYGLEAQKSLAPPPGAPAPAGGAPPPAPAPVPPGPMDELASGVVPPEAPEVPLDQLPPDSLTPPQPENNLL